ncbi:MAG: NifU family protein [Phycisphaeraceae bacterium]|nr:NifU family protein [Phycisphaeraceae bacterium]
MPQRVATDLHHRVSEVLELIRPAIQADGGDIELVGVDPDGTVILRFRGACTSCPSRNVTLQSNIEHNLRERVPEVRAVHALDR